MKSASLFRSTTLSVCALTWLVAPVLAAEKNWPQFRGAEGQGISKAEKVPVVWSSKENIAWSVEVPGKGWSSPAVVDGRIYLTSAVGESQDGITLHALCFNAEDGKLVWNTELFKPSAESSSAMHRKNSLASPSPLVAGDRVYVHFGHMGTAALSLDGKVVWKQESLKYPPIHGNGGSPVLVDGKLIFSCDAAQDPFVVALDAATGEVRWKTPRQSPARKQFSFSTPLVITLDGKTQVISPGPGLVGSYDVKDGAELWRVRYGEGYSVIPRPVYAHGLLFVSSCYDQATFYAIRPEGAKGDATETAIAWTMKKGAPHTPSALAVGDEIYTVSDAGIATCADAKTGTVHWTQRIGGNYSASPFLAEGRVYFQNETGVGTVVQAGRTYEELSKNDLGEPTLATPAVVDGALFIRGEKHLWRIGAR